MSASVLSRASSGKRAPFMDLTASSAENEREKATPSRQPSARSNVSAVPTNGEGSSPRTDKAKTIEMFLQDARNTTGMSSPGAGSLVYSPMTGSRAQSPTSPGPRGAARSRSVSQGRAERTPSRAASSTTMRWNAPLPGDTLAARPEAPASPGTPAVLSAGALGTDAFAGDGFGFGGSGSFAPARALSRAANAPFEALLDPALRHGVEKLVGDPTVAASERLLTVTRRGGFVGSGASASGATFGPLAFSREHAVSVAQFREAAITRDRMRIEGGSHGSGFGGNAGIAAKAEIARLGAAVAELTSEMRAIRAAEAPRSERSKDAGRTRLARDDDDGGDDEDDDDENVPPSPGGDAKPRSHLAVAAGPVAAEDGLRRAAAGAFGTLTRETDSREADGAGRASFRSVDAAIRAAARGTQDRSRKTADVSGTEARARRGDGSEDPRRGARGDGGVDGKRVAPGSKADPRYLRTTRRDSEAARRARGLKADAGSPASQLLNEGRGAVGLDTDDSDDDVGGADRTRSARNSEGRAPAYDAGVANDAAAAFAAALSALDARRAEQPDPAATIARLKERNRALTRELGVAQRLMTGYHAQLMTGGAAPRLIAAGQNAPPPSYAQRRTSRRPFEPPDSALPESHIRNGPRRGEPLGSLRSTRRAERKRTAAERSMSRAERAFAETAAKADAAFLRASDESAEDADVSSVFLANARGEHSPDTPGISRIAEEVAALKQAVAGLIGRLDADTERRDAKERARAQISRSPAGSTAGSGSERRSVVASPAASPRASDAAEYPATRSHDEAYRAASPRSAKLGESPDAPPASEVSFAFDDDGEARAQASDGTIPKSAFAPAMSPAMSLETDTAFLQTPATSPGGGTPQSRRPGAP